MRAGDLDRKITLQRATVAPNEFNESVETWADLARVSAKYTPVADGERFRAGERAAEVQARFLIRWSSQVASVNPKDRLVFDGRIYAITNVKEIGRREGLEITAGGRGDDDAN